MINIDKAVMGGVVRAPPSKPLAMRFLLASLLSDVTLIGLDEAPALDFKAALRALNELGVRVHKEAGFLDLSPPPSFPASVKVDAGGSASLVRMLAPILAAAGVKARFDGDQSLMRRPMTSLVKSLEAAGVTVTHNGYRLPMEISGHLKGHELKVFGEESSQQVTGFMYALALQGGGKLTVQGLASKSYVELTRWVLSQLGVTAEEAELGYFIGGTRGDHHRLAVGGDYLISSFYVAASMLTGGSVRVEGLYPQLGFFGDHSVVSVFSALGAEGGFADGTWEVKGWKRERGALGLDFDGSPDMAISVSPLLAVAGGELKGISRLSLKESDRVSGIIRIASSLGLAVDVGKGLLRFKGGSPRSGLVDPQGDHRLAMMASSIMAVSGGRIEDATCVSKSDPSYWERYASIGGKIRWVKGRRWLFRFP
ncbi:hypothetical protein PQ610_00340 [Tardisphaera miroshnichenkoae]